jgi:hypothetical protein
VHDSVEEDEYVETINKLGANVRCLEQAEGKLIMMNCDGKANEQNTMLDSNRKSKTCATMHTSLTLHRLFHGECRKGCLEMKG